MYLRPTSSSTDIFISELTRLTYVDSNTSESSDNSYDTASTAGSEEDSNTAIESFYQEQRIPSRVETPEAKKQLMLNYREWMKNISPKNPNFLENLKQEANPNCGKNFRFASITQRIFQRFPEEFPIFYKTILSSDFVKLENALANAFNTREIEPLMKDLFSY